jgi:hypothetical protein
MSEKLELINHTLEELRTETYKKRLSAKRICKKEECAKRIRLMVERGDNDNNHINQEIWRIMDDMDFTMAELRKFAFRYLKQDVMKRAKSHEKTQGAHRSIYLTQYGQIDIYTTRNVEALKEIIKVNQGKAATFSTIADDASCQLYRVNHNIDNYSQVDLFEALEEAKAIGE